MRILVLNAGTATLKGAVFESERDALHELSRASVPLRALESTEEAFSAVLNGLGSAVGSVSAVGHRIVHGGRRFVDATTLDASIEAELAGLAGLAPLHQPVALRIVRCARSVFAPLPQVAAFDTEFHAVRSGASLDYALPPAWTRRFGLHRYGFHGLAHASLVAGLGQQQGTPLHEVDAVTLQLGSGCSACAVSRGKSVETSMGFTPLEGLVMGTRSGDVDPGVLIHLLRSGVGLDELEIGLRQHAGILGMAGTADVRALLVEVERGEGRATRALDLFVHRIVLTVGAYLTLLGGPRPLVFGGGIGENAPLIRARIVAGLAAWGMALDALANEGGTAGRISTRGATPVYVVPTNEEAEIARRVAQATGG